ncbi:T9SS type A sorting domain-containing protein [bacterium]|nr:T9SS type A sorting domain-containing protein [bacterium]
MTQRRFTLLTLCLFTVFTLILPATAQDWISIGPSTASVEGLYFTPHNDSRLYATGELAPQFGGNYQLMVSEDGGSSFTWLRSQTLIRDFAVHPTSPDTLYSLDNYSWGRSYDGGQTWTASDIPLGYTNMTSIYHAPGSDGPLYMLRSTSGQSTLIRSLDEGETWELMYDELNNSAAFLRGLLFRPGVSDTLYTVRETTPYMDDGDCLWRSMDGGETWEPMGSQAPSALHWDMHSEVYFHPDDPSLVYAVGEVVQGTFGMVSHDGGATFGLLTGPWGGSELVRPMVLADGSILVFAPDNMYLSEDLGQTWEFALDDPSRYPLLTFPTIDAEDIIVSPYNADHFHINYRDLFMSSLDAGLTWNASVDGFRGAEVQAVTTSMTDPDVVHATIHGGIMRTENRGQTWSIVSLEPTFATSRISPYDGQRIVTWALSTPWLSDDGGSTWLEAEELHNTTDFAFHPVDQDTMVCIANPIGVLPGVYRTGDGGESWLRSAGFGNYLGSLCFDPTDPDRVVMTSLLQLYESHDSGLSFEVFYDGDDMMSYSPQPDGPGAVAVATEGGNRYGLYTDDRSVSGFTQQIDMPFNTTFLDFARDGWLICQNSERVMISPDLGDHWWEVFATTTGSTTERIAGVSSDGTMYVAGGSQGVLMSADALSVDEAFRSKGPIPRKIRLHPVYPNPFNSRATVSFDLPRAGTVTVSIFDILGRPVQVLADGRPFPPGSHQLTVDAGDIASGLYFVRLSTGDGFNTARRITVLK